MSPGFIIPCSVILYTVTEHLPVPGMSVRGWGHKDDQTRLSLASWHSLSRKRNRCQLDNHRKRCSLARASLVTHEESACGARDLGLIPGSGRSPGEGNGNPLQYSCLGNPWTEGPAGLQSVGCRVRHDWVTNTFTFTFAMVISTGRKRQSKLQMSVMGGWLFRAASLKKGRWRRARS